MSGTGLIGPSFVQQTITTEVYCKFSRADYEVTDDGSISHISHGRHWKFFRYRIISVNLWLPSSPELSTCFFRTYWIVLWTKTYPAQSNTSKTPYAISHFGKRIPEFGETHSFGEALGCESLQFSASIISRYRFTVFIYI